MVMSKKNKKLTLLVFDEAGQKEVRSFSFKKKTLSTAIISLVIVFTITIISLGLLSKLYSERKQMLSYKSENELLKIRLTEYAKKVNEIESKLVYLEDLEKQVRELAKYADEKTKKLAVGGKEIDILRDYSATAERKESEFFNDLNNTLLSLSTEIEKKQNSLSELINFLEEQRLMTLSTPSIWPVRGWISSKFGYRISPFTGRRVFHEGIDIAARYGAPVRATAKGIVIYAGYKPGYGKLVTIDHGFGYVTRYAHNSKVLVKVGQRVEKGDIIAKVGSSGHSTGPHVHYEVLVNGVPVNPLEFINEAANDQ
ncbi:peptidase, M23/M37 family [Deferribacter desulfuricans SSM1]|uniref:Peptidase, M23/M37 family n=2 Tax=Deferribacter TaxID=53572 RepID=D3PAU0_DEFDS|nr:peptidase, M23/M37 family [Deferribacter desulfuricans SSM1]